MMELYFMLEEPSMKELLKTILPRVLPEGVQYHLIGAVKKGTPLSWDLI